MTGEDLEDKPDAVEQANFNHPPLGKFFNRGLDKDDKKEGLLKILKNNENKNKEQLEAIEDQQEKQFDTINEQIKKTDAINKQKVQPKKNWKKGLKKKEKIGKVVLLGVNLNDILDVAGFW